MDTLAEAPQSALSGVARVLVHAGRLNAKTAEDLVKSAKEKKASFISSVIAAGAVAPSDLAHTLSAALALPLLIAMERGSTPERDLIRHAIEHGEVARLAGVVEIVRHSGAIAATREAARSEANLAAAQLARLPSSEHREALLEFCARSVERSS